MPNSLLTTSVGSLPKPDYLLKARAQHARGALDRRTLDELSRQAVQEWIAFQDALGIDILVDGEQAQGDLLAHFVSQLDGFTDGHPAASAGTLSVAYRKPVISGAVKRRGPITVESWRFAQSLTTKPVKAVVIGPYTLCDWSFNEYYSTRRVAVLALAEAVREEALDLERAGAEWIQIDEYAVSMRLDEMDLAVEAITAATRGLQARTITHLCCADLGPVSQKLYDLPVDQLDLELSHNADALSELFGRSAFKKTVGLGVINVHHHKVETQDEIKANIRRGLKVLSPQQVYVDPDCGLKTRTVAEAQAKLRAMVSAAGEVRRELRLN
jgi:5-methyltetrahydropteroyltriglutamate--homocysteine methyltransferase